MGAILVLNGPNLNLLGQREPHLYGRRGLADIERELQEIAQERGHRVECHQTNAEHLLVEHIHQAWREGIDFVIINPGAYTHTSIALRDAFLATRLPFIEVHLSNIFAREPFRHRSFLSDIAAGIICGFGPLGYRLALEAACDQIEGRDHGPPLPATAHPPA